MFWRAASFFNFRHHWTLCGALVRRVALFADASSPGVLLGKYERQGWWMGCRATSLAKPRRGIHPMLRVRRAGEALRCTGSSSEFSSADVTGESRTD